MAGVFNNAVGRANLCPLVGKSAQLVGLGDVLKEWMNMPRVGIRRVAAALSPAGGQGFVSCACTGTCQAGRCACRKVGRMCNSRCHKGSQKCKNC